MKKYILSIIIITFMLSRAGYAKEIELPHISVFGTAVTKVIPDKMIWNLQIQNKNKLLADVAKEHLGLVRKVTALLEDYGVKEEDIQTSRMGFGENWVYKNRSRIKEGYYAQSHIVFSTTNFDNYEKIWGALSKIQYVSINGVQYDHTERITFQNETRKKALLAAREKARVMAETIGSEIAEPLLIEEIWQGDDIIIRQNAAEKSAVAYAADAQGPSISPGQIPIRMKVKVAFRLITHNQ